MPLDQRSRDQITNIRQRYHKRLDAIRNDKRLSAAGRERAAARLYLDTRQKVDAITQAGEQAYRKRVAQLERDLFGIHGTTTADVVTAAASFRDAQTHVDAAVKKPGDAARILKRALRSGDAILAKAVFSHAYDQIETDTLQAEDWGAVVNAYLAENEPDRSRAVELGQLRDMNSRSAILAERIGYTLDRPGELRGYSDHTLSEGVRQDTAATQADDGGEAA